MCWNMLSNNGVEHDWNAQASQIWVHSVVQTFRSILLDDKENTLSNEEGK